MSPSFNNSLFLFWFIFFRSVFVLFIVILYTSIVCERIFPWLIDFLWLQLTSEKKSKRVETEAPKTTLHTHRERESGDGKANKEEATTGIATTRIWTKTERKKTSEVTRTMEFWSVASGVVHLQITYVCVILAHKSLRVAEENKEYGCFFFMRFAIEIVRNRYVVVFGCSDWAMGAKSWFKLHVKSLEAVPTGWKRMALANGMQFGVHFKLSSINRY